MIIFQVLLSSLKNEAACVTVYVSSYQNSSLIEVMR
jgi:hypothetical protein